ncbi:MAG: SDR family NAD(P)-dependent oxidoreductase [Candidatus Helarchaeota archaeon]
MKNLEKRLLGKNIIITGAASGIGKAMAELFAQHGANLALVDINEEAVTRVTEDIRKFGIKAKYFITDVSESKEVKQMGRDIFEHFGQVDVLVNNAGIGAAFTSIIHLKEERWDQIMKVNLKSVFLVTKYIARRMIKNKVPEDQLRGKIINMSSMRGKSGRSGFGAYGVAKAGIVNLTQTLAQELGPKKITVNAICPGLIHTPIYGNISIDNLAGSSLPTCLEKFKPVGLPEDVAKVALFLASSDSDFTTGQSIPVSGGQGFV